MVFGQAKGAERSRSLVFGGNAIWRVGALACWGGGRREIGGGRREMGGGRSWSLGELAYWRVGIFRNLKFEN